MKQNTTDTVNDSAPLWKRMLRKPTERNGSMSLLEIAIRQWGIANRKYMTGSGDKQYGSKFKCSIATACYTITSILVVVAFLLLDHLFSMDLELFIIVAIVVMIVACACCTLAIEARDRDIANWLSIDPLLDWPKRLEAIRNHFSRIGLYDQAVLTALLEQANSERDTIQTRLQSFRNRAWQLLITVLISSFVGIVAPRITDDAVILASINLLLGASVLLIALYYFSGIDYMIAYLRGERGMRERDQFIEDLRFLLATFHSPDRASDGRGESEAHLRDQS